MLSILLVSPSFAQSHPWPAAYKLRNHESARLTAADFPGPGGASGLVYPNFFQAGLPAGVPAQHPRYQHVVSLAGYAGYDNTGTADQWPVITRAIEDLHARGGGVLEFGAGTFRVNESILIPYDNIVLRGAGRTATKLDFRPGITNAAGQIVRGIKWLYLRDGDTVPHDYLIQTRAMQTSDRWVNDAAFDYIRIFVDGVERASTGTDRQGGPNLVTLRASDTNSGIAPNSSHTLMAEVRYSDGAVYRTPTITVRFTEPLPYGQKRLVPANAAISFSGDEWSRRGASHTFTLEADAPRGATSLRVIGDAASFALIRPGEIILLEKPAHGGNFLVERAASADRGARYLLTVTGTNGVDTLQVAEPLREDFLRVSGSRVKSLFMPVRNVGVEDLWIDQSAEQVWTSGIHLLNTYQGWVRNVQVTKTGRFPIWPSNSKNIEIRDVVLRDAWYRLGGGTAYIGCGESNDILLDGVEGSSLRHGPNFGSYASGNVVRHGRFEGMDTHVGHNAWVAENLIELSLIDARQPADLPAGFGTTYGPAVTHEPRDGPQGPRSVFYHNTLKSDPRVNFNRPGIDTSGGMEAMYYIANKIYSPGTTVAGAPRDIDLVFEDNVFIIERSDAGVALMPQDNVGWEFRRNTVYGGTGQLLHPGSTSLPLVDEGNVFRPFDPDWNTSIPAPSPAVPSIYAWQLETRYPAPPAVPTALAVIPAHESVTLTWSPVPDAAAYVVKWGSTPDGFTEESSGHVAPEATITGLQNGRTYHFTVAATNPKGRSADAAGVSASPGGGDVPTPPSGLAATVLGATRVDLSWSDEAVSEDGFLIERRNGEFGPWARIGRAPADTATFTDATLWPNQQVHYRVRAARGTLESAASNVAAATTADAAPAQPVVFEANAGTGQVRLRWSLVYNATSYTLARGTSASGPFTPLASALTVDGYTDTSVTNGVTYYYTLTASNAVGSGPSSVAIGATPNALPTVTFTAPAAGTALVGPANITLTLNPQDADGAISRVELYQGATLLAVLPSAPYNYVWNNVAPGSYTLRAVAIDNLGATAETTRYLTVVDALAPAQAPVMAEGFDYAVGTLASQMTGGTGFRSLWSGGAVSVAAAGSLSYLDAASSRAVVTSGNRLTSGSSTFISGRFTARDPNNSTNPLWPWLSGYGTIGRDGTVFWLSFLLRFDGASGWAALRTDSGGDELFFGSYQLTGGRLGIQRGQAAGSPVALTDVTPVAGQTYLLVVRYEYGANNNDAVTLWVNPRIDGAVPSGGSSVTMSGVNATWQQVSMRGSVPYSLDEIRAGGNFRDVVPAQVVAQPPTITLTAPLPATTVEAPATIEMAATTTGAVARVEFYAGSTKIAEDAAAPYSCTWTNVEPGNYSVRAVAVSPVNQTAEATRRVEVTDPARVAQPVVIAEPFDYPVGTLGSMMNGGLGLRGTWNGGTGTTAVGASLAYHDQPRGLRLATAGNRLASGGSAWVDGRLTARDPNTSANPLWPWLSGYGVMGRDGSTFWVSYLLRFEENPSGKWAAMRMDSGGGGAPEIFVGTFTQTGGQIGLQLGQAAGAPVYATGVVPVSGQTYLLVLKFEFGTANNDTVRLWVNPRLGATAPESPHTAAITGINANWQKFTFRGSAAYSVDELRGGAAFADVTPTVPLNAPPVITKMAAVAPAPVTGTHATLGVEATDDGLPGPLSYTWSVLSTPGGAPEPAFSVNGNSEAREPRVDFAAAGDYRFQVAVSDGALAASSVVDVTVVATVAGITVSPAQAAVNLRGVQPFTARARDQFGALLVPAPMIAWSVAGPGVIDQNGVFVASAAQEGVATVEARGGGVTGTATVTVTNAPPVAYPDTVSIDEGGIARVAVLANDRDADDAPTELVLSAVASPARGSATIDDGHIRYTPEPGFYGVETIAYTVSDGLATAEGTLVVTVNSTALATDLTSAGLSGSNVGADAGRSRILADGTWELTSTGFGFGEFNDELHLELMEREMNFTLTVQVVSVSGTHPEALVGVILRDGDGAGARQAMIGIERDGTIVYGARGEKKRGTLYAATEAALEPPAAWLRLERRGTLFILSHSADGRSYREAARGEFQHLPHRLRAGLFASAGDTGHRARGVFAHFQLSAP